MFKNICEKLLENNMQLFLLNLENETMYTVNEDFLESYDYILPKGENISRWCAKHSKKCVHENDRDAFINFLNPYEIANEINKSTPDSNKLSLYFRNKEEEWRYISIQRFERQFLILKIEKVEISDLAARVLSASRKTPPKGAKIKTAKDFHKLKKEFTKFPPASIGLIYVESKNSNLLCEIKDILAEIFLPKNCYKLNNEMILALTIDESSENFQHNLIDLYSSIDAKSYNDLYIGSHWTCDEDEEDPFAMLERATQKTFYF